ncbi:MAG: serine hydrolase [Bacteroidota bacterium]|nr:serine hydrolase [Bacteroidota bacterium]MDP4216382.1 serine hydrolase [Bacteroidota bacterium]MDP4245523.1 serine hydrolase [Bacteroidota bacterium]MDP4255629.1 serine hydrolase [Bacteroidota bacterium]MDP4258974.1 serine hydrolase [Bacteroidota bacterium]
MRKYYLVALTILLSSSHPLCAQDRSTDAKLQSRIAALLEGFHGKVGVFVANLKTGKTAAINADSLFPTASQVKVSILLGVMDKIRTGQLDYHQVMIYKDSLHYAGVDILGSFKDGEKIELSKIMMLMLTMSDNTASLWLQGLAGGGIRINQLLDSLGFHDYRVNSRTPGREAIRNVYGWGQTTPREMVRIFQMIHDGKVLSPAVSERMLRLLGRDYWDEYALSQIPPDIFAACKGGAVDQSRSETVLVSAPHGTYIFSVETKDLTDTTWQPNNEGWVLARRLSHLLWDYFEPHSDWRPSTSPEGKVDW